MQVVTNQQFVTSRARLGNWATISGFLLLAAGFVVVLVLPGATPDMAAVTFSYLALIMGLWALSIGRYNKSRWGRRPREEEVLAASLKGLDYKYRLLNYLPHLPVDHLLISPHGLFVIEARPQFGNIINTGQRWRRKGGLGAFLMTFAEGGLGNPTRDALRSIAAVRKLLGEEPGPEEAQESPVEGVIVFTSPLAKLEVREPVVPVVAPKDLRAHVRSAQGRDKMPQERLRKLIDILERGYQPVERE